MGCRHLPVRELETGKGAVTFDRTRIMGVLNVTPDSFSDGGRYFSVEDAYARALEIEAQGADFLDIGGESTRPGSLPVGAEEEQRRVLPVLERVAGKVSIPISIDTWRASTARLALEAGADMINDVTALRGDKEMLPLAVRRNVPVVLMHALWPPETMQNNPEYQDVVKDVVAFLEERGRYAVSMGMKREKIIIDPGIGFGKTLAHNLELLRNLPRLLSTGYLVLVGPSRKSFLGMLLGGKPVGERDWGTAGAVAVCAALGAHIVRVHNVSAIRDVTRVVDAIVWQV